MSASGNFAVNNNPCDLCTISSAGVLNCICSGTIAMIDLSMIPSRPAVPLSLLPSRFTWLIHIPFFAATNIDDVTGVLCFANNEFGPVCGTSSSRRC